MVVSDTRLAMLADQGWRWMVRLYYGPNAKSPKTPEQLAIETVHKDDVSKDLEVEIGEARPDISLVDVIRLRTTL